MIILWKILKLIPLSRTKEPASGGAVLPDSLLSKPGQSVSYRFDIQSDIPDAKLIFRYTQLHWNATVPLAEINLALSCSNSSLTAGYFSATPADGGKKAAMGVWPKSPWGISLKDTCRLTLAPNSDRSDVVTYGFWLISNGFKMTREELASLNRLQITGRGYMGIDLTYSGIEQSAFSGFSIVGRSFEPDGKRVSVELLNDEYQVVSAFCKDRPLLLNNRPSSLQVPDSWIQYLLDGNYTLHVSWANGENSLSQPFVAFEKLLGQCEKMQIEIASVLQNSATGNPSLAADIQYASDYFENSLILLRSRGNTPVEESAYKKGVAYFEKANLRTTQMFTEDLGTLLRQTKETIGRLDRGKDPYQGRTGDLWRAFYSEATGLLEPYRIYIPSDYEENDSLPVILMLHGGGDENYFSDLDGGVLKNIMEEREYITVSPKATGWYDNSAAQADLKQLLNLVRREYPKADPGRFYCTGDSCGGYGTYQTAGTHPDLLAGIACVSGIGNKSLTVKSLPMDMSGFKRIPILILHGGSDSVVPLKVAEDAAKELKDMGCNVEFRIFPRYGHNYHAEEYMKLTLDFFEKYVALSRRPTSP